MKKLLLISALIMGNSLFGQTNFYKQYSSNGYDYAEGVDILSTGEILVTGSSSSFVNAPSQMYILKLSAQGDWISAANFGGIEADGGKRIKVLADDSYFVGGYTQSIDSTNYDMAVWYFNVNGELQWTKAYGTLAYDRLLDMTLTDEEGLILIGETYNTVDGFADALIIRIEHNGDEVWRNQIEKPKDNRSNAIKYLVNDSYLMVGEIYDAQADRFNSTVTKLDGITGAVEQEWEFSSSTTCKLNDFSFFDPNIIYATGEYINEDSVQGATWYRINLTTGLLETEILNESNMDARGVGITKFDNELVAVVTHNGQYSHGLWDIDFHKCAEPFYWVEGLVGLNHLSNQVFGQIVTYVDNGFIAVGSNDNWGSGGSSIFVVRRVLGGGFYQPTTFNGFLPLVSVDKLSSEIEGLKVYPNPIEDAIIIDLPNGDYTMSVCTIEGKLIKELKLTSRTTVDLNELNSGTYLITIENLKTGQKSLHKGMKL